MAKAMHEWEKIDAETARQAVPGGWRYVDWYTAREGDDPVGIASTYVPDPTAPHVTAVDVPALRAEVEDLRAKLAASAPRIDWSKVVTVESIDAGWDVWRIKVAGRRYAGFMDKARADDRAHELRDDLREALAAATAAASPEHPDLPGLRAAAKLACSQCATGLVPTEVEGVRYHGIGPGEFSCLAHAIHARIAEIEGGEG